MDKNFETHKATLLLHADNFWIIDFRREDKSPHYWVRFYVDTMRSSVHIEGDLGHCISCWGNANSIRTISEMMLNVPYWVGKFECSSDLFVWNERRARSQLETNTYDYYEECPDQDEYYEKIDEIMDTFDVDNGITLCTREARDYWDELGLDESFPEHYGREIHPRVRLWAESFDLALKQLDLK